MAPHSFLPFIAPFRSAVIGTIDAEGLPFTSYAPFVHYRHRFHLFISDIARHSGNIRRSGSAALLFIDDESATANPFARKRLSLQCRAVLTPRDAAGFDAVMAQFRMKFDDAMIETLLKMRDFNLYTLEAVAGEATFGFGEAYTVGGETMEELLPRRGGGHRRSEAPEKRR